MRRVTLTLLLGTLAIAAAGAERKWQTGTWGDITLTRRMVDFGPGASGFGRPGSAPEMRAMADVRRLVLETDALRLEVEDTVSIGRRSFEATTGGTVTFALEKNTVYVRAEGGTEHKLRVVKKIERAHDTPTGKR
jgi:hypothetical protein